jgi:hypothetical protein
MLPESITVTWKLVILAKRLIMMTRMMMMMIIIIIIIIIMINGIRNNARITKRRPRKLHYFEKLENSYLPQKMFG